MCLSCLFSTPWWDVIIVVAKVLNNDQLVEYSIVKQATIQICKITVYFITTAQHLPSRILCKRGVVSFGSSSVGGTCCIFFTYYSFVY